MALDASCLHPPLKRCQTLSRMRAREQIVDAHIFIEVRPMDTFSVTNQPPFPPFRRLPSLKTRIPRQRDADGAPIHKIDR